MQPERKQSKTAAVLSSTILTLALLFTAACSWLPGSSDTADNSKNPADIHVGFVTETQSENFAIEMAAGAQYAANQYHVSAQIVAPVNVDDQEALRLFQGLVQTARDGIGVETLAPNIFAQPEANAVKAGIPIIAVDTTPFPGSNITTYVGNDNIAAGKMLANAAVNLLPENARGSVLIGSDTPQAPVLAYRVQGIVQAFRDSRPNLQIVSPFDSRQHVLENYNAWNDMINKYPNIVAALGVGDPDNASLAQIKQSDHSTFLTGAFDLNEAGLQAVANGTNFALVDPEHFLKGYVAMRLLIEHALHKTPIPTGWWNTGAMLVTQGNVQSIVSRQVSLATKGQFYQPIADQEFADPTPLIKPLDQAK